MLSVTAQDAQNLWEEELKLKSKLGIRLSELDKEKTVLISQVGSVSTIHCVINDEETIGIMVEVSDSGRTSLSPHSAMGNSLSLGALDQSLNHSVQTISQGKLKK